MDDLIEQLADAEHASWASWMDHLFSKGEHHPDGSFTIPALLVERWQRQTSTAYRDLSEREKEADRVEVRKILPLIHAAVELDPAPSQPQAGEDALCPCWHLLTGHSVEAFGCIVETCACLRLQPPSAGEPGQGEAG